MDVVDAQGRLLGLIEAGSAVQVLELAAALRGEPLPPPSAALVEAACAVAAVSEGGGVGWPLVSSAPLPTWQRAVLVSDWLTRWAAQAHPAGAWLATHAVRELSAEVPPQAIREQPAVRSGRAVAHGLLAGTAELLRHHLSAPHERCCIDLVSEDRADWQRNTPLHRVAFQRLAAEWVAARLTPPPHAPAHAALPPGEDPHLGGRALGPEAIPLAVIVPER